MDKKTEQSQKPTSPIDINISVVNKKEEQAILHLNLQENSQVDSNLLSPPVNIQSQPLNQTIRSSSSSQQFDNSKIIGFDSGKIIFKQTEKKSSSNQDIAKKQKIENKEITQQSSPVLIQEKITGKQSQIFVIQAINKLIKEKKAKKVVLNDGFEGNKLLKLIFSHFCKENYISSIKSTLFEEKPKLMEEMTLNKWMVFCKQFDIFINLCKMKIQLRKKNTQQNTETLSNSQLKQGTKVKEIKQVQKILIQIFKKATEHHTKMDYIHFIQAIKEVSHEFKPQNIDENNNFERDFLKNYLYCSSQKQCLNKLANLKFTFNIPQIQYGKPTIFPTQTRNLSRSRAQISPQIQKQNIAHEPKRLKKTNTMSINPILKDAKDTITHESNSKSTLNLTKKIPLKLKPTSDQPKITNPHLKKKAKQSNKLFEYFDTSSDEILQAYFKVEQTVHID